MHHVVLSTNLWLLFCQSPWSSLWSASFMFELIFVSFSLMKGFPGGSVVKNPPANAGDTGSIPGLARSLEKEMATHSCILAWEIAWTEEPGGLCFMGSQESDTPEWLSTVLGELKYQLYFFFYNTHMWRIIHRQKHTRYQLDKPGNTEYALSAGYEHDRMLFRCLCQPSSFLASNLKVMASF